MTALPVLNCDGCGACCLTDGAPPFDERDIARQLSLPQDARDEVLDYLHRLAQDEAMADAPCCWYDPETRSCRHYEWRPQVCRDMEVGGEICRVLRQEYRIEEEKLLDNSSAIRNIS